MSNPVQTAEATVTSIESKIKAEVAKVEAKLKADAASVEAWYKAELAKSFSLTQVILVGIGSLVLGAILKAIL